MFRALKVFFAFLSLVLSIQAVVTTSADVDHDKEASVTVPWVKLLPTLPVTLNRSAVVLNGPLVIPNQPSAASANLRKKEEVVVELEGM